jgi:hypothetical protein
MNLSAIRYQARYDDYGSMPRIQNRAKEFYSPRLVELVERCLEWFPEDRPSSAELWEDIRKEVAAVPDGNEGDLPRNLRGLKEGDVLRLKPDLYALFTR